MRASWAHHGRRLLVLHARAPSCAAFAAPARRRPLARPAARESLPRSFIQALFQKPPRQVRQPEYEPGWMEIMVWRSHMLDNLRPPGSKDLILAWKKLMESKLRRRVPLNSTQALQCRRLLEYLAVPAKSDTMLPFGHIDLACRVMLDIEPQERTENHADFARALHSIGTSKLYGSTSAAPELQWSHLLRSLSIYGASADALRILYLDWDDIARDVAFATSFHKLVESVAHGLAREGREKDLLELVERAKARTSLQLPDGPEKPPRVQLDTYTRARRALKRRNRAMQAIVFCFFAARDRVPEAQQCFQAAQDGSPLHSSVYSSMASFARRNGLQDWAMEHLRSLGESCPLKVHWDALLQGVILVGKGLNEVAEVMTHMVDRDGALSPDTQTLNTLLGAAVEMKDATLAADIMALGADKGLEPDGETHLILLRLCLATGESAAAREAWEHLRNSDVWRDESRSSLFDEYRQLLNDYLVVLSREPSPDSSLIAAVIAAAEEDQIVLQPEPVAALCLRFLKNEQHFDIMDLLAANAFMYSEAQREPVQDAFIGFCLDGDTSTRRAWDAYQLLNQLFQETSPERRTRLMHCFFDRKRPDMAAMVFGHMRQHRNQDFHPRLETYVECLERLTEHPNGSALGLVHNMLKMDTTVQPTTRLYTAMMLAYTACDKPLPALDFWAELTRSREGPSYASLEAVFWTLEKKQGGCKMAREIWQRVQSLDLEVPPSVYNAYVGAIAGSGELDEAKEAITNMSSVLGSEPDKMTLAIAHNALPGPSLQEEFREWAKAQYREAWTELDKFGRRLNEFSQCRIQIKRIMKP